MFLRFVQWKLIITFMTSYARTKCSQNTPEYILIYQKKYKHLPRKIKDNLQNAFFETVPGKISVV